MLFFTISIAAEETQDITLFEQAEEHRKLLEYQEAIDCYFANIARSKNHEEVWLSKIRIGECYNAQGLWDRAVYWYLEAYQYDPTRIEPLYTLASNYRQLGEHNLTCLFAHEGLKVPSRQTYLFSEELSISAFYTQHRDEGLTAANDLILSRDVSWNTKHHAYRNLLFYVRPLQGARFHKMEIAPIQVVPGHAIYYYPMNPTICKTEEGYKVICRMHTRVNLKHFCEGEENCISQTKNFLLDYDRNFNEISRKEIIENLPRKRFPTYGLDGLEDSRIFSFKGGYWFTCTTLDTNPNACQLSLCKLEEEKEGDIIFVEKLIPLQGPDPNRQEKNWLPIVLQGKLHLIYSCDPFILYSPHLETGECKAVLQYTPKQDFARFSGSAPPIPFNDGYLMMVHEFVQLPDYSRCYTHRFVYLNQDLLIEKISLPFTFFHVGIEFCGGMALTHSGKEIVFTFGVENQESYMGFVDIDTIWSLLNPLPKN